MQGSRSEEGTTCVPHHTLNYNVTGTVIYCITNCNQGTVRYMCRTSSWSRLVWFHGKHESESDNLTADSAVDL